MKFLNRHVSNNNMASKIKLSNLIDPQRENHKKWPYSQEFCKKKQIFNPCASMVKLQTS